VTTVILHAGDPEPIAERRLTSDSDEELVRACARGDEGAFTRLLERHRARVTQLVRWQLGGGSLWAEDVAQDVFVQLHRHAASFAGRSSFKTWLYAVALNVCRGHLRRERGARRAVESGDGTLAAVPDVSLGPLERLEKDERAALVRAAVERLTPAARTVLLLRDWEELSYEQMAEVLEVPIGTVRSRLHNARAALAQELSQRLGR
jgi:RNA polymerase sigma-70 factor, ECF subfamily